MREFAAMSILNVWYARFDVEDALARLKSDMPKKAVRRAKTRMAKARTRDSTQALAKLTTVKDGRRQIISDPPLIVPLEELADHLDVDAVYQFLRRLFTGYTQTLPAYQRRLAERFTLARVARKVVGVGSVGTETWILLMEPDDGLEPLLLQAKQAQRSVLAGDAGQSEYRNQGERVVTGQHLMQAVSDIFLGWQRAPLPGRGSPGYYYLRQLRDWKYSADTEGMNAAAMAGVGDQRPLPSADLERLKAEQDPWAAARRPSGSVVAGAMAAAICHAARAVRHGRSRPAVASGTGAGGSAASGATM